MKGEANVMSRTEQPMGQQQAIDPGEPKSRRANLASCLVRLSLCASMLLVQLALGPVVSAEEATQGRQVQRMGKILDQRQRPAVTNRLLEERLEQLLPGLMREADIDLWLVINREYNEDPVYLTLVPEPVFAARRTTILMFHDRGEGEGEESGVERLTVSRYSLGSLYAAAWEGGDLEEQWKRLAELVRERNPRRIGVNVSDQWPVADGLSASLERRLRRALGEDLSSRITSAEQLVVRWIETRSSTELEVYPHIVALARRVIAEVFSEEGVTPGVTTTDDIAWALRQRFADLDLPIWFMPYVNRQHPDLPCTAEQPFCGESGVVRRGDVLHTDVGICYLRLCTDTQEMAYVLKAGETAAPAGLVAALAAGNRFQDLLTAEFETGRSGNQILARARESITAAGIEVSIYTHPLGHFGHAPGPTIGMWDNQGPTPHRGDWLLYPDTVYAIEGNIKAPVPEWGGQRVQIKLEQDAVYDGQEVRYLAGRQTRWHLIP